jgi:hypothetical protein
LLMRACTQATRQQVRSCCRKLDQRRRKLDFDRAVIRLDEIK